MKKNYKGIILAGGTGSRLFPLTKVINKQLLPVYDKPMIFYPLSTLILSGITEILIICKSSNVEQFNSILGNGSDLGLNISYEIQDQPNGLPEAFVIGENFIKDDNVMLILGDNIFHGNSIYPLITESMDSNMGAVCFAYQVKDPSSFGVAEINEKNKILSIEEKPKDPKSNLAVTGMYLFDNEVIRFSKKLKKSSRGETEIVDLLRSYLANESLECKVFRRGVTWLDTGTFQDLIAASNYFSIIENRQGNKIACIEEVCYEMGLISKSQVISLAAKYGNSDYAKYILEIME